MLSRAAKRSARLTSHRAYIRACEQLQLPWLCPSYSKIWEARRRLSTDAGPRESTLLRRRRNSRDGSRDLTTRSTTRRSLATHVDNNYDIGGSYSAFDSIPFDHSEGKVPTNSWDTDRPLILGNTLAEPARLFRFNTTFKNVGGELRDVLAVLEACLQVGRTERSEALLKKLYTIYGQSDLELSELVSYHNHYLQVCLNKAIGTSSEIPTQAMHKWFELEINDKKLPYNVETLAYMLKASLQSVPGQRRDRLIKRYMGMAQGNMGLEILSDGMFTAEDLHQITSVIPTYNYTVDEFLAIEETDNNTRAAVRESALTAAESRKLNIPKESLSIPEVRSVDQKGLGLSSLKQALSLFDGTLSEHELTKLTPEAKRQRQLQLEEDAVTSAINRWREESAEMTKMGVDTKMRSKSIGAQMWGWHVALSQALRDELVKVRKAELINGFISDDDKDRCIYGPFLRYLPVDKLAATTILATMHALSAGGIDKGVPLAGVIMAIANAVEDESISEKVLSDQMKVSWGQVNPADRASYLARIMRTAHSRQGPLITKLTKLLNRRDDDTAVESNPDNWDPAWSTTIKAKVGSFLLGELLETAKIAVVRRNPETDEMVRQMQPAFSHAYQYKMGKKTGLVTPNSTLVAQLKREPVHSLLAKHLPMVIEPEPWTRFNKGGYIKHPTKAVRIKQGDKDQTKYIEAAVRTGDMDGMFKGLDVLGRTAWKINKPVFDIMLEAWNSGEGISNFPPAEPNLEMPVEPEASQDPIARRQWARAVKQIENLRGGYHSQRCFQNFQLEIARALREETFYFPHNVDFRGRAYPIPPYLNHMGADHCRGLLKFGVGKELGVDGLRWLKVHLANVYGFDKASLSERAEFADQHIVHIKDSAKNPLKGSRWWLSAEDPWQCLAACIELSTALESPDATRYVSHLPVHQDGTCNGLQHYAALGGDEWGAKQVNLEPGDRPADVYSAVADLVRQSIAIDKAEGSIFGNYLDGKITRKVVKQTVMTNVYGVTFTGAKAQVKKQLIAAYPDIPNTLQLNAGNCASYVATKIFKALSTMFKGAHDIQYWFGECASRVSTALSAQQMTHIKANLTKMAGADKKTLKKITDSLDEHTQFKSSVIWTNPLRMPIVQPYRSTKSKQVTTNLQRLSITEPHPSDPVSRRKQLQGFPPNFVHSLDATHMIVSAIECEQRGLSFAAVHDSFWTHAADIASMNAVLRDAFIQVHSDDVVGRLAAEFKARYRGSIYLARVKAGSEFAKALSTWRKSRKPATASDSPEDRISSRGLKLSELLNEHERQRLLASKDPEDHEKAKKIVTAATILETLGDKASEALSGADDIESAVHAGSGTHATESMDTVLEADEDNEHDRDTSSSFESDMDVMMDDTDAQMEAEAENEISGAALASDNRFERRMKGKARRSTNANRDVFAWLPLTFPDVPEKGTFDVRRLKDSQYFFS